MNEIHCIAVMSICKTYQFFICFSLSSLIVKNSKINSWNKLLLFSTCNLFMNNVIFVLIPDLKRFIRWTRISYCAFTIIYRGVAALPLLCSAAAGLLVVSERVCVCVCVCVFTVCHYCTLGDLWDLWGIFPCLRLRSDVFGCQKSFQISRWISAERHVPNVGLLRSSSVIQTAYTSSTSLYQSVVWLQEIIRNTAVVMVLIVIWTLFSCHLFL